jgi:hypothetical protein
VNSVPAAMVALTIVSAHSRALNKAADAVAGSATVLTDAEKSDDFKVD